MLYLFLGFCGFFLIILLLSIVFITQSEEDQILIDAGYDDDDDDKYEVKNDVETFGEPINVVRQSEQR